MGIPSYFAHIIKTFPNIVQTSENIVKSKIKFDRLYMDCNSLLYDCFRNIDQQKHNDDIETELIRFTIERIEYYIAKIGPSEMIFIAFDGVAPFAKMDQQRTRRYRSCYESFMAVTELKNGFSTSLFTPGTAFMKQLSLAMQFHFGSKTAPSKYGVDQIIVATPEEAGEGEHKLYAHLRKNPMTSLQVAAIYGLDADLIMLSLLHLQYVPQLYVFREVPAFAHVMMSSTKGHDLEPCFLDILKLGNSISSTMGCRVPHKNRMLDYVFLCFFLGNDFLPHFPALNIRTNGIQRLLDVYNETIGNKQETFLLTQTTPPKINWSQLHIFIKALSNHEHTFILQEYALRKKWDSRGPRSYKSKTPEERLILLQDSPILFRQEETYICPKENFWEERYYQRLLSHDQNNLEKDHIDKICVNYLEGLEWVLTYYLEGCCDWKWKYNYNYPPLLKDLTRIVPKIPTTFFYKNNTKPFKSSTQLIYVLPPNLHKTVLPEATLNIIQTKYSEFFLPCQTQDDLESWNFQWAFCRYFWECHIKTPEIPVEILEEWDSLKSNSEMTTAGIIVFENI